MQDLYRKGPTQETRPRDADCPPPTRQRKLDHTAQGSICPVRLPCKVYSRSCSGNRSSFPGVNIWFCPMDNFGSSKREPRFPHPVVPIRRSRFADVWGVRCVNNYAESILEQPENGVAVYEVSPSTFARNGHVKVPGITDEQYRHINKSRPEEQSKSLAAFGNATMME